MATQSPSPAQERPKLRKGQRTPSVMSRRSSSIFEGKDPREKGYWNELMCMLTGLSANPASIVGVTSLNNKDYFNDQPSPPRSPLLRARSSRNSIASSSRPAFSSRLSSRSLLRRVRSGRATPISAEDEAKPELAKTNSIACEPLMEVDESSGTSFDDILSTVPESQPSDVMVTVQSGGRTLWLPQRVIQQYSAISTEEDAAPRAAKPDMKLQIPTRSSSKDVVQQPNLDGSGQILTLVDSYSTTASESSPGSHRSDASFSSSSMRTPSLDSPSSAYSSGGSSLSSLEIDTPVDGSPIITRRKKSGSVDSTMSGIFEGALDLVPPPIKPRNPRRAMVQNGIDQKDFGVVPAPAQLQSDLEQQIAAFEPPSDSPPVPQRSERRAVAQPVPTEGPPQKLATRKSFGDLALAVMDAPNDEARVNADAAEAVIFNIYLSVTSLPDLFSLARVNNGFYAVYKRYELILIKTALRNHSAACWELAEISDEDAAKQDSSESASPMAYLQRLQHDTHALAALKAAILERCQSFLRPCTIDALSGADAQGEAAIDDALWRIWSFCLIFGSGQGREADADAQADWLRGGPLAQRIMAKLGRATFFGQGNGDDGLTAAQLYDMTELWNCITSLVSGIAHAPDAVERARAHGIFDGHDAPAAAQPALLEDWLAFQVTHGLAVVLDLATVAADPTADVFAFAADAGLAAWQPLPAGPAFLRDALARAYADRLAGADVHPALRERRGRDSDRDRELSPNGFVTPREMSARPASSHYASATSSSYSSRPASRDPSPVREVLAPTPKAILTSAIEAVTRGPWA